MSKAVHKGDSIKKRLAVLVSGSGTNLQAVIDACNARTINAEVCLVVSTNINAFALTRARDNNILTFVAPLGEYTSVTERDKAVQNAVENACADYIILAGYLGILSAEFVRNFPYKIINIHPSLLPKYGGKGFYGINVHKAVIAAKEPFSGATAHFVDENVDTGLIIRQQKLAVLPHFTPEILQEKILQNIEHKLLVEVLKDLCSGSIYVDESGRLVTKK